MQVNSINSTNFKGTDNYNDLDELRENVGGFNADMTSQLRAIKDLRDEFTFTPKTDEDGSDEKASGRKSVLGILGSIAAVGAASYFMARGAYKKGADFVNSVKTNKYVNKLLTSETVTKIANNVKDVVANSKKTILSAIPEKVKANKILDSIKNAQLVQDFAASKASTKAGLIGAVAGTFAASKVDGNENGEADMFEKGISLIDSVDTKFEKVINLAKVLS